jgi:hypothetical protein
LAIASEELVLYQQQGAPRPRGGGWERVSMASSPAATSLGKQTKYFFCYIGCMGLSTGMSRQKPFKYFRHIFVKNIRNISYVTTRTSAPVGAPRRPESPSDDIAAGRASLR